LVPAVAVVVAAVVAAVVAVVIAAVVAVVVIVVDVVVAGACFWRLCVVAVCVCGRFGGVGRVLLVICAMCSVL
jgi:hypothetical protein